MQLNKILLAAFARRDAGAGLADLLGGERRAAATLERPDCALCGPGPPQRPRHEFPPYGVVACEGCGLVFLSPRPTRGGALALYQDPAYYDSETKARATTSTSSVRENWLRTFGAGCAQIRPLPAAGRVLDVGCGPGFFLDAAPSLGYEAWGIDPSAYAVVLARETTASASASASSRGAAFEPASFDLVTAQDAFEHVYDPQAFLEAAHRLLTPGRASWRSRRPTPAACCSRVSGRALGLVQDPRARLLLVAGHDPPRAAPALRGAGAHGRRPVRDRRLPAAAAAAAGRRHAGVLRGLVALLNRVSLYANNGSLTVIARRREPPGELAAARRRSALLLRAVAGILPRSLLRAAPFGPFPLPSRTATPATALLLAVLAKTSPRTACSTHTDRGAVRTRTSWTGRSACGCPSASRRSWCALTGEPGLALNLQWLGSTVLAAATAAWALRRLGHSADSPSCSGSLYAFLPYGFYRNVDTSTSSSRWCRCWRSCSLRACGPTARSRTPAKGG